MKSWLNGITVLDFTTNVAGPFGTLALAAMGARVIKVERPPDGDPVRAWPPFRDGVSAPYVALNRGKESVILDLTTDEGRAAARRLADRCDVLIESWKPGTAAKLGFEPEILRRTNPALIYCSVNAFGGVGKLGNQPGYDAIIQAYSGIMDITGEADGPPVRTGTGFIDYGTGMWAAMGVLGALIHRGQTGRGCDVTASLLGTASTFEIHHLNSVLMTGHVPKRNGTAQHNTAPYEAIRTRTGLVMIGVSTPAVWRRLLDAIDDGRIEADPRFSTNADRVAHRHELVAVLEDLTSALDAEEVVERLAAGGVPASVIRTVGDLANDPQMQAMGLVVEQDGELGLGGLPLFVDGVPADPIGSTAVVGAHTEQVLEELAVPERIAR